MTKFIYACDKCKKEVITERHNAPDGWKTVKLEAGPYNYAEFEICPDCQPLLGIYDNKGEAYKASTIADRLLEIVEEMVISRLPNSQC